MDINEKIELGVQKYLNKEGFLTEIAKELKIPSKLINERLSKLGYFLRGGATPEQVINLKHASDYYINHIDEKISLEQVAKKFDVGRSSLSKRIKALGYEVTNYQTKTKFNEHVFDCIDTEEKAYWLGFIFADGYIDSSPLNPDKKSVYNFELSLKADDSKHLDKFNKFMEHINDNVKISNSKCEGKIFKRCRWGIANKRLWNTLNSYGCTPRKSLTLEFPNESIFKDRSLIKHFIRGYWDGDGCLSWADKDHKIPCIEVVGTESFLLSIQKYLNINYKLQTKKDSNAKQFSLGNLKAFKIAKYLYNNSTIYLDRKYERYLEYCRLYEESDRLLETNIGEGCDVNPEITTEIKESVAS